MANGHYVIPKLVEDTSLKRARVVDGNGDSYIRVTGTVTSSDLDPIKEALGEPTDTSSDNTVIGLLKKIDIKQFGVGQAYEGSTGGEIFNYYGTDSNKNEASGDYSTANGYHNASKGNYSFTAGKDNAALGTASIMLGRSNEGGANNTFALGKNLVAHEAECTYVGIYNNTPTALTNPDFVVGVGTSNSNRKNAIECKNTATKICNALQLADDSTEVTAIVPPVDPNNPITDDQTLATKAFVSNLVSIDVNFSTDQPAVLYPGDDCTLANNRSLAIISFVDNSDYSQHTLIGNLGSMYNNMGYSTTTVDGYDFKFQGSTLTYKSSNTNRIWIEKVIYIGNMLA